MMPLRSDSQPYNSHSSSILSLSQGTAQEERFMGEGQKFLLITERCKNRVTNFLPLFEIALTVAYCPFSFSEANTALNRRDMTFLRGVCNLVAQF